MGPVLRLMHDLENRLSRIVLRTPWLFAVLRVVRDVEPVGAYVAAGAIRDTVWNHLTGRTSCGPYGDVDLVFFEPHASDQRSVDLERDLRERLSDVRWDVTNQAHVHQWYRSSLGHPVEPFRSVREAIAHWPETATAVGARLKEGDHLEIVAPLGLEDLFSLTIRHNSPHRDAAAFRGRVASKCWRERWPELSIVEHGAR